MPIDAEADERAVMLVEGAASLDGQPLEPFALYVLEPGHAARLTAGSWRRASCCSAAGPSPRRATCSGISSPRRATGIKQAKQDWIARRFPLIPAIREEFIPYPAVPKTVSYP